MSAGRPPYDPTIYLGSAPYYAVGRPPYSAELAAVVASELDLDGHGRLLDVGCGPGVLTLDLGPCRVVTFGQSFHWTDRERVAELVYDLLEPAGAIVLVVHTADGRDEPPGPDHPPIPHEEIRAIVECYLGPERRSGQGLARVPPDRYEDALGRTRFGRPRVVFAPGRPDIVRDADGVIAGYFSLTTAAPHLFDDRRAAFEAEVRELLAARSPDGWFRDWPGDTEILIARRPS